MRTTVIIPALNEEASIGQVLAAIPIDVADEIIVVDGGSSDGTVAIARDAGAHVIHEPRRGYGRACATGLAAARGEVVLFLDADGADDPGQIPDLLAPILAVPRRLPVSPASPARATKPGRAVSAAQMRPKPNRQGAPETRHSYPTNGHGQVDMVLGSRLAGEIAPGAMPWHQRFGNRLAAWLIRCLYGLPLTDLSPLRAVRREALLALGMEEMTFGWPTEMIVKAARRGWRVVEIPVRYHRRLGGQSKISGTMRGTILATYYILWTIFRYSQRKT